MNKISLLLSALLLSACEKPMPFESAEFLAENPERLKELNLQCRADRSKLGDAQRIRFMGKGTLHPLPRHVLLNARPGTEGEGPLRQQ
ncbi:entry exclusion lipoprotein TrbK [Pseudomonas benzenivorans]|uniref:entry exclusion lipoprotein TrbK n=1 Tax=Pseudomonas benzenivorans TaxID=556533 RepID=UPI002102A39F|nr:entry exclusion lipoprotein TrbK [Pseudomonas benzenivorans]